MTIIQPETRKNSGIIFNFVKYDNDVVAVKKKPRVIN